MSKSRIISKHCTVEIRRNSTVDMIASNMRNITNIRKRKSYEVVESSRILRSRKNTSSMSDKSKDLLQNRDDDKPYNEPKFTSTHNIIEKQCVKMNHVNNPTRTHAKLCYRPIDHSSNDKSLAMTTGYSSCLVKVENHPINQPVFESGFLNPMKELFSIQRVSHGSFKNIYKCEYGDCTYTTTIKSSIVRHIYSRDKNVHKKVICRKESDISISNNGEGRSFQQHVNKKKEIDARLLHMQAIDKKGHQNDLELSKKQRKFQIEKHPTISYEENQTDKASTVISKNHHTEDKNILKNNQICNQRTSVAVTKQSAACPIMNLAKPSQNRSAKPNRNSNKILSNSSKLRNDRMVRTRSYSHIINQQLTSCPDLSTCELEKDHRINQIQKSPDSNDSGVENDYCNTNETRIESVNMMKKQYSRVLEELMKTKFYLELSYVIDDVIKSVTMNSACHTIDSSLKKNVSIVSTISTRILPRRNNIVSNLKKIDKLDKSEILTPGWRIIKKYENHENL